jgi:TolB-like protein/DNA-binding winged helix-turn-helix (wHTH) protein
MADHHRGVRAVGSSQTVPGNPIRLGDNFELDVRAYELRRSGQPLKLERLPMELLQLLVERNGQLVTREQIVERIWGKEVFVDTDNSINAAIRKIRHVLEDDSEQPRFVQTVTGRGYRFIALVLNGSGTSPVKAVLSEEPVAEEELVAKPVSVDHPSQEWASRFTSVLLAVSVVLIVALGAYFQWSRSRARPQPPSGRLMVAVLPFENLTGDASQEYFSDGMTEEMITELAGFNPEHLGVIARTSVMFYKHNPKPLDQVGRELGVQYVLEGSVRRSADQLRVTAQLIRVQDQTHLWARQYDREVRDLLVLQREITQEIADELESSLDNRQRVARVLRPSQSASYEAYDLYIRGRFFWNKRTAEGFQKAAEYFQQAIALDPNYARAYAGLADTFGLMSTWSLGQSRTMPKARAAALKALQLDETLAEAHTSLGLIAENYDYDWQTAEKEFRRAIQLDPDYPTAHQWYAECLSWQGRFDEALAESERARKLDPLSLIIAVDHGANLYYARKYDRAIAQFRAVIEMDPQFGRAAMIADAYVQEGRYTEALDEIERHSNESSGFSVWASARKVYVYGRWGQREKAQQAAAKFEQVIRHYPLDPPLDPTPYRLIVYIALDQKDQVIALLQKGYSAHSSVVVDLKVEPRYDPLRSDPRFQDLLRRVGLAQ